MPSLRVESGFSFCCCWSPNLHLLSSQTRPAEPGRLLGDSSPCLGSAPVTFLPRSVPPQSHGFVLCHQILQLGSQQIHHCPTSAHCSVPTVPISQVCGRINGILPKNTTFLRNRASGVTVLSYLGWFSQSWSCNWEQQFKDFTQQLSLDVFRLGDVSFPNSSISHK